MNDEQYDHTQHIVMHIDMNAFFASVEQQANPFIRNKPVAVAGGGNKYDGAAVLAASYPAKKLGIGLSTRLGEAKRLCPDLIVVPLNHLTYYSVNRQIIAMFREICPCVEVYSIDEAFLDVTEIAPTLAEAEKLGYEIQERIKREIGEVLTCSVGISHNKLLAKVASDYKKPDAVTVIPWERRFEFLDSLEFKDLWGIGWNSTPKLHNMGIRSTKDIRNTSDQVLASMVGSYYTRLRMIANGEHYDLVNPQRNVKPQKSMQHAHTLAQTTNDEVELKALIRKLSERLARRMRRHGQQAKEVSLGLRPANQHHYGWGYSPNFWASVKLDWPSDNGYEIYLAACKALQNTGWTKEKIRLAVVGLGSLTPTSMVGLGLEEHVPLQKLDSTMDAINNMFGEFTIRTGDILYEYSKERELTVDRENMTFHPD
jgi:DNA polymerase IV